MPRLEKLKTDHIDYYLVHALVGTLWDNVEKLGVADFLTKAKADGRIRNAGFSFHGAGEDFSRIVDAYDWDFCQIQYNFLDEKNQAVPQGLNMLPPGDSASSSWSPSGEGTLQKPCHLL